MLSQIDQTVCIKCGMIFDVELDEIGNPLRDVCANCVNDDEDGDEEYDCPIHGELGGIDECPRC